MKRSDYWFLVLLVVSGPFTGVDRDLWIVFASLAMIVCMILEHFGDNKNDV